MKTNRKRPKKEYPAWVRCPSCDDFYCSNHRAHVYDCECPGVDEWGGVDPYRSGGAPIRFP